VAVAGVVLPSLTLMLRVSGRAELAPLSTVAYLGAGGGELASERGESLFPACGSGSEVYCDNGYDGEYQHYSSTITQALSQTQLPVHHH
jgi:hypothetical protein